MIFEKNTKLMRFLISLLFIKAQLYSQCSSLIGNFPDTINGIVITENYSGVNCIYPYDTTSFCGIISKTTYIGCTFSPSSFTQTITFSAPVNGVTYVIMDSDSTSSAVESFSFSVNNGVLSCTQAAGCFYLYTQHNNLFSANSTPSYNAHSNGAFITLNSTTPYNVMTIYGVGGNNGSLMALCSDFIMEIKNIYNEDFKIFPSPVNSYLNCKLQTINCKLQIIDILGNILKTWEVRTKEETIDVSDLPGGIYFVQVKTAENITTQKTVIQH